MQRLKSLRQRQQKISAEMDAILAAADEGGRDVTAEESDKFDSLEAEAKRVSASIKREEALLESTPSFIEGAAQHRDRIENVRPAWQDDPKCGFGSTCDFLMAVVDAGRGRVSPQMQFLAAAGSDEQSTVSDSYGGYLIPRGFSPEIKTVMAKADPTADLVQPVPMSSPVVDFHARVDKNHSSSVSGGLTVAREAETQEPSSSRMQLERIELKAAALIGLSYVTEQLLERSPVSVAAILDAGFRDEFAAKMLDEKLNGNGVGKPLGVINSACTVSVTRATANNIKGADLQGMRKRAWNYGNSVWLANHDTLGMLTSAHVAMTSSDVPLFTFSNGADKPDMLMGRPIYFTEFCPALGSAGDLILGDWSQYLWGTLGATEIRTAESVHVRFLNHERTFKFWIENCGQPWWRSPLTPKRGANTLSPFVMIAA